MGWVLNSARILLTRSSHSHGHSCFDIGLHVRFSSFRSIQSGWWGRLWCDEIALVWLLGNFISLRFCNGWLTGHSYWFVVHVYLMLILSSNQMRSVDWCEVSACWVLYLGYGAWLFMTGMCGLWVDFDLLCCPVSLIIFTDWVAGCRYCSLHLPTDHRLSMTYQWTPWAVRSGEYKIF